MPAPGSEKARFTSGLAASSSVLWVESASGSGIVRALVDHRHHRPGAQRARIARRHHADVDASMSDQKWSRVSSSHGRFSPRFVQRVTPRLALAVPAGGRLGRGLAERFSRNRISAVSAWSRPLRVTPLRIDAPIRSSSKGLHHQRMDVARTGHRRRVGEPLGSLPHHRGDERFPRPLGRRALRLAERDSACAVAAKVRKSLAVTDVPAASRR